MTIFPRGLATGKCRTNAYQAGQPQRDCPYSIPEKKGIRPYGMSILRFNPFIFACCPLRKFQDCDRRRALKILDCLSKASFQNLARLTEQTGPEGEMFVGAPFFWILFLGRVRKVSGDRGRAPFRTAFSTLPVSGGKDQRSREGN